eukprot:2968535-Rhodomonas_salina.3
MHRASRSWQEGTLRGASRRKRSMTRIRQPDGCRNGVDDRNEGAKMSGLQKLAEENNLPLRTSSLPPPGRCLRGLYALHNGGGFCRASNQTLPVLSNCWPHTALSGE